MKNRPRKNVLFISHDATRTGAPIILSNQLRWIKENTDISFEILLKEGGELETEFASIAPTWRIQSANQKESLRGRLSAFVRRSPNSRVLRYRTMTKDLDFAPDLIYSNTITNGEILKELRTLGCPIVTHVHELDFWITQRLGERRFRLVDDNTDLYITVSAAVGRNLIENQGVNPERIRLVHGFVPAIPNPTEISEASIQKIRADLGIPNDAFVVGGSGTTDWRKAPEHFIQLAYYVRKRRPNRDIHFVWVGGEASGDQFAALQHDLRLTGLKPQVHFVGRKQKPLEYFATFDVFAMVSREDPFPLVNLEAASLRKPIVCFDRAGGSQEFVEHDAGIVIPYLDIDGMAASIVDLMECPATLKHLGERARHKVLERHDIAVQAPKIADLIYEILAQTKGVPRNQSI